MEKVMGKTMDILPAMVVTAIPVFCEDLATIKNIIIKRIPIMTASR